MNSQDYEKAKAECWEEYKRENLDGEVQWQPVSRYDVFCAAFDRAYALSKQTEVISQEYVEKAASRYDDKHTEQLIHDMHNDSTSWKPLQDGIRNAFLAGANFALGKQEKDTEDGSLWSRLTDDEKREMQCRYHTNECILCDHKKRTGDKAQSKAVARMKLLENLFGKENIKTHNNG